MKKEMKSKKINEIYVNSWNFVKSIKNYILIICCLLVFSVDVGMIFPGWFEQQVLEMIKQIMLKSINLKGFDLVGFIFMNNLQTSIIGMVSGLFFGIFPVILTVVNGYFIGFVINRTILLAGPGVLWRLFPHGIFELPAVVISLAMGLKLGTFIFFHHKKFWREFWDLIKKSILVFIFIVIPLLMLAGIIEGFLMTWLG